MVNFSVLFHAYNLVTSPYERAVIQTQKFGNLNTFNNNSKFFHTILRYSSKVLAWIHAIHLFARLSKARYRDL